jgi:hypothetical protein
MRAALSFVGPPMHAFRLIWKLLKGFSPAAFGSFVNFPSSRLMAGKWYFNIHTAANKGGEIRGQATK